MMWNNGWSVGGWVLMGALMLAFWWLVIGGTFALVRRRGPGQKAAANDRQTPRQILDERFARGELTEEEYQRRTDLLAAR